MARFLVFTVSLLITHNIFSLCASAAVHSHNVDTLEREFDGSYRSKDSDHYSDSGHNSEFDHEAILGSVKEAEEFDKLSPEESKRRLALLVPKMDLDHDKYVSSEELKKWILNSFAKLAREEAEERMEEADSNRDGVVSWSEYLQDAFGADSEDEVGMEDTSDSGMLLYEEKEMWAATDANGDGKLDISEFEVFTNPEDHESMHAFLIKQAMREKDKNGDGLIEFQEYVGERGETQDKEWLITEKEKFDHELDLNKDGILSESEIRQWIIPDNEEIASDEVDHLFAGADDDHDLLLSFDEILEHHDLFVGSEATDYGADLMGDHLQDEL